MEKYDNEINESLSELRGTAKFNSVGDGPKLPKRDEIKMPEE